MGKITTDERDGVLLLGGGLNEIDAAGVAARRQAHSDEQAEAAASQAREDAFGVIITKPNSATGAARLAVEQLKAPAEIILFIEAVRFLVWRTSIIMIR